MIRVKVEVKSGALTTTVAVTSSSIERSLRLAGGAREGVTTRLVHPVESEAFFADGSREYALEKVSA